MTHALTHRQQYSYLMYKVVFVHQITVLLISKLSFLPGNFHLSLYLEIFLDLRNFNPKPRSVNNPLHFEYNMILSKIYLYSIIPRQNYLKLRYIRENETREANITNKNNFPPVFPGFTTEFNQLASEAVPFDVFNFNTKSNGTTVVLEPDCFTCFIFKTP